MKNVLFALGISFCGVAYAQVAGDRVPDQFIVQLQPGANAVAAAGRHGVNPIFIYGAAVHGYSARIPPGLLRRIEGDPQVLAVAPDRVVTISAGKPGGGGGGGGGTTQTTPLGVERVGAPGVWTVTTGAGVGIAVVDTGIDLNHPDLAVNGGFTAVPRTATAQDDHGHGTHVAGISAARNNSIGVVGVAPGATLYAVKVLDSTGSGSDSQIVAGLDWIAANANAVNPPIRVVNMSLGRPGNANDNPALRGAVQTLVAGGITVVVAAGNSATAVVEDTVPASYPEVIAVASTTAAAGTPMRTGFFIRADTASYFTTDGAGVGISAPGEDQENLNNGGLISAVGILSTALGGGTTRMSGTSMASPHVAGVAALLYQFGGVNNFSPANARAAITAGARSIGVAPFDSPTGSYSFDGVREGVLSAPGALNQLLP